jgi:hypothetical protein
LRIIASDRPATSARLLHQRSARSLNKRLCSERLHTLRPYARLNLGEFKSFVNQLAILSDLMRDTKSEMTDVEELRTRIERICTEIERHDQKEVLKQLERDKSLVKRQLNEALGFSWQQTTTWFRSAPRKFLRGLGIGHVVVLSFRIYSLHNVYWKSKTLCAIYEK